MVPRGSEQRFGPDGEIPGDLPKMAILDEGFVADEAGRNLSS